MRADSSSRHPCPCCGHLALPQGPGDYELCPVCFWEDDIAQLRWPMSPDGANGISLMEAQQTYQRIGAMDKEFRRQVRRARRSEPLEEGWRPFDPSVDWTAPTLDGERWPKNYEALYYWRTTYWNGDPDRLPAPASEVTGADRLVEHLRREVPETRPAIEAEEWRLGFAPPMRVCERVADVALDAYRSGDPDLGLRIATALVGGLDETSEVFASNCVAIGFLENDGWHEPAMQPFIDEWPEAMRTELREQQAHMAAAQLDLERQAMVWGDLFSTARGQPVDVIEDQLRSLHADRSSHPRHELEVELVARVMSDHRWLYKHPVAALGLAWRHRRTQSPLRTLTWLRRPRFAG